MATRQIPLGAAGGRLAANLEQLRRERGMNQSDLSTQLAELDRPLSTDSISKIESGGRRADAADILALAVALRTTPNRLLLTEVADDTEVELTPNLHVKAHEAWRWVTGEALLPNEHGALDDADFVEANRPHNFARYPRQMPSRAANQAQERFRSDVREAIGVALQNGVSISALRDLLEREIVNAMRGRAR